MPVWVLYSSVALANIAHVCTLMLDKLAHKVLHWNAHNVKVKKMPNLNDIKANRLKLDECKKHEFAEIPELFIGVKLTCKKCGGKMDALQACQYALGFEAAGGDPNQIIAGFR